MNETVLLASRSASELTSPTGSQRVPAVIVCHEWFGLNDDMRRVARRIAAEGYLTLAVDLYEGRSTADKVEAKKLATELKTPRALEVIAAAIEFLKEHPRSTGRVGATGFCLGGGIVLAAASNLDDLAAVVPFYGLPLPKYFDAARVTAPVQGHYARQDESVPRQRVEALWAELIASPPEAQLFFYEAGHAFMRESDPAVYEPEDAEVAWQRMLSFFRRHLLD